MQEPNLAYQAILDKLAVVLLEKRKLAHPLRVAVDGIDAAGKTTLADALSRRLEEAGIVVIRATLDGFHRPRTERYQRGAFSAEGYYEDSFNYPALIQNLLQPLGQGGDRRIRRAVFDYRKDERVEAPVEVVEVGAVLLLDGVFLLRPELLPFWDVRIFLKVDFETALERGLRRDGYQPEIRERYERRYFPAQRAYLERWEPEKLADVVVEVVGCG